MEVLKQSEVLVHVYVFSCISSYFSANTLTSEVRQCVRKDTG